MSTPYKHEPAAVAAADLAMPGPISVPRIAGSFIPAPLTALQPAIVFVSASRGRRRTPARLCAAWHRAVVQVPH
jgi:hypothetical protein